MYIVKVLKRRDAASVVVAIVLGFILITLLPVLTTDLASFLSGITDRANLDWRSDVVQPIINSFLQIIVLEAILRLVIYIRPFFIRHDVKKSKKS